MGRSKKYWKLYLLVSFFAELVFFLFFWNIIKLRSYSWFNTEVTAGSILAIIIFSSALNFYRFFLSPNKPIAYPKDILLDNEKVIREPYYYDVLTKWRKFTAGIQNLPLIITNQRIIIPSHYFGHWSFRHNSVSIWFFAENAPGSEKLAREIRLNKQKDSIVVESNYRAIEIVIDKPEEILTKIYEND